MLYNLNNGVSYDKTEEQLQFFTIASVFAPVLQLLVP
jgi:hypothetical protein